MGVEPTAASFALPATDFEDQGAHRDTCQPTGIIPTRIQLWECIRFGTRWGKISLAGPASHKSA